jgi:predicted peptidase
MKATFTLLFAIAASVSLAQSARVHKEYSQAHYRGIRYGWYAPTRLEPGKLYPLVLYLHGSGDTVSRDNYWYKASIQHENPVFVLAPKCVNGNQGWGNTWSSRHSPEMSKSLALLDSLAKKYPIDPNRLYIYGISMGGFGVFSVLQKNPGKFAGAYAICGGSDPGAAAEVMKTPLWIFHGDADDIVPVHLSRDIYNEIVKRGGKLTKYTEYPGVKHNSWDNANKEPDLPGWLLSQKRK